MVALKRGRRLFQTQKNSSHKISKLQYITAIMAYTTAKNTVISPDFLVWKFWGKAQFPHSFGRFAIRGPYAKTVPFRKIPIPRNQMKLRHFSQYTLNCTCYICIFIWVLSDSGQISNSATFYEAAFVRRRYLLEDCAYFMSVNGVALIKGQRSFETRLCYCYYH